MRYQVLKQTIDRLNTTDPADRFLSKEQYQNLLSVLSRFEQIFLSIQKLKTDPEYLGVQKKAGMFMQHYLIVLQMAVMRGEIPESALAYYGFKTCHDKIPAFNTGKQILSWGERIFDGDSKRIANGGKYITNPGIAVVKVWYEKFQSAYQNHRVQVEKFKNNQDFVCKLRNEANQAISELCNELEYAYDHLPPDEFRKIAGEFGISYKYSDKEIAEENQPQTASLFEMDAIPVEKPKPGKARRSEKNKRMDSEQPGLQTEFAFTLKEVNAGKYE